MDDNFDPNDPGRRALRAAGANTADLMQASSEVRARIDKIEALLGHLTARILTGEGIAATDEPVLRFFGISNKNPDPPASSMGLADADAGSLNADYDFDVYEWSAPADGMYLAEVVLGTAADPLFLPYTYVARANLNPWWNGHELVLLNTVTADHLAEIADDRIQGGAGYGYTFEVTPLAAPVALTADDTCDGAALFTSSGLFTIDLSLSADDVDPAGVETCADRHVPPPAQPGEGVDAPGPDRMLRLVVGSGQTLSAATRGSLTDVVLYLLPDDGLGCDPAPDPCLAASDTFGISDSETLLWTNAGPDRDVWLVVDEFGGSDSDPAAVTIFVRIE